MVLKEKEIDYTACPVCGAHLIIDSAGTKEEFNKSYACLPKSDWIFYCEDCGNSGNYVELQLIAETF